MRKENRWYAVINGMIHVYDHWYAERSTIESVCSLSDLSFYRRNFRLRKVETPEVVTL